MMRLHSTLALALALFTLSATPTLAVRAQTNQIVNDSEAYAVYASVVRTKFSEDDKPLTALTLLQETRAGMDCVLQQKDKKLQPEWRSVVQSYRRENARVRIIREGLDLGVPYSIVTVAQVRKLMREAGYSKQSPGSNALGADVLARFPGGRLIALSAVGFNPEKTRSIVAVEADCFPSWTSLQQVPRDTTQPMTGTARLSGRVVAADTNKALARAIVQLAMAGTDEPRWVWTDAEGRWQFSRVPAGRYSLLISKTGYLTLRYGQVRPFEPGKPIVVGDGQVLDRLDVALPKGAAIAGRISDEHGSPIAGVLVSAMRYRYSDGQRRLTPVTEGPFSFLAGDAAITDDLGQYRLHGLSPGDYYVAVGLGPPAIPEGQADDGVGYAPSFYPGTISLAQAERVTLRVGQDAQHISFAVTPIRFATVSGIVLNSSGRPVQALNVGLSGAGPTDRAGGRGRPDGTFVVTKVAPGDYVLRVSTGVMGQQEMASLPVTVSGQDVTGLTAVLAPGGTARGRVIFEGNPASPPRVLIAAFPTPAPGAETSMKIAQQLSDGTFEIRELWNRQLFRTSIADAGAGPDWTQETSGWFLKSVAVDGNDITDDGYEFKPGQNLTGIEIVLSDRATTLAGSVHDDRERPVGDYTVVAFATDSGKWGYRTRFVRAARPDQNGKFLIKGLPPGAYQVVAVEYLEAGEETDPVRLENWRTTGTSVILDEGEARSIALRLLR